ncbi:uncharacterized protein LOC112889478 [Panicum hallii]|uniref:uncharacterized protein LOC112889478 n=1 Tax=Panicum hallii TaxID=206008 RepID=UPI000DF4CA57|nr:uncharacterized protein LOC112889478 [Panicum hallii]
MMWRPRPFTSTRRGWGRSPLPSEGDEIHGGTGGVVTGTTTAIIHSSNWILGVRAKWWPVGESIQSSPTLPRPHHQPFPKSGSGATRSSQHQGQHVPQELGLLPCVSHQDAFVLKSYAARGKLMMRAVPPIRASFQPAFPQHSSFQDANRKKQTVPCYQRQQAPQIEAKIVSPSHPLVKRSKDRQGKKVP